MKSDRFWRLLLGSVVLAFAMSGCSLLGHEPDRDDHCDKPCCCTNQSSGSGYVIYSTGGSGGDTRTESARIAGSTGGSGGDTFRMPCPPAKKLVSVLAAVQWQGTDLSNESRAAVEQAAREYAKFVKRDTEASNASVLLVVTSAVDVSNPAEARVVALKRVRTLVALLRASGVSAQALTPDRAD